MYMNGDPVRKSIEKIFKKKVVDECIQEALLDQCIGGNKEFVKVIFITNFEKCLIHALCGNVLL